VCSSDLALTDKLKWRAAIKKFDNTKKLNKEQLAQLLEAIQLAPTSLGLQHFRVLVIEDIETRKKLKEAGYSQPQLTDASQIIVFAAETNINEEFGKNYIDLVAHTRGVERDTLAGFEDAVLGAINRLTDEQKLIWAQKQAYIALGVLLSAAADLNIDATPMEGFDAAKFDEILKLKEKGLTTTVIATVGFRAQDDFYSKQLKVRRPKEEFFIHI